MQPATGDFLPATGASPSQAEIGLQPEVGTQVQRHHVHIFAPSPIQEKIPQKNLFWPKKRNLKSF